MKRLLVPALAVALSGALSGCTFFGPQEPLDEGSYQAGYGDGCSTGSARQNAYSDYLNRDETRYGDDRSYRAGWNSGFRSCRGPVHDPIGANPGTQQGPGH